MSKIDYEVMTYSDETGVSRSRFTTADLAHQFHLAEFLRLEGREVKGPRAKALRTLIGKRDSAVSNGRNGFVATDSYKTEFVVDGGWSVSYEFDYPVTA